jgi:N-acetylmuramic acid 6-phosphate (MurNAc-6-P) etherase
MEITLDKIELVKDRAGITYAEAKNALIEANGSVVDALINLQADIDRKAEEKTVKDIGKDIAKELKELIKK